MSAVAEYEQLVGRGCLCGTDRAAACPIHGPSDNRGLRAFFRAGMPLGFPYDAICTICRSDGLMYPDVRLDSGESDEPPAHRPTLVCPTCSSAAGEHALVTEVLASGLHQLNARRVFAGAA
jgi:hypothetical protein